MDIQAARQVRWAAGALAALAVGAALVFAAPCRAASCDWPAVKKTVDAVIAGDKSAEFKKRADDGHDSLETVEDMLAEQQRPALRDCRWEAGEYLTKRGFPPLH